MNATIVSNYFNALEALLLAGTTYAKAVKALIPEYNKANAEEKVDIRNRVAQAIGKKYGVKPKLMESGSNKGVLGFNQYGNKAESSARAFMRNNFKVTKVVKGGKKTTKVSPKVDKVEVALAYVEALSKAEQAVFFKRVSRKV